MKRSAQTVFINQPARRAGNCLLSVLVPFYNVDPDPLVRGLLRCCQEIDAPVEIIAADDGSDSRDYLEQVVSHMDAAAVPCALLVLRRNRGRSAVRNTLCRHADGHYVLFLDGDVRIPGSHFIEDYLELIEEQDPDMIVGGFRMSEAPHTDRRFRLQQYVSRRQHCPPLPARHRHPGRYAYASNLLVRRRMMLQHRFDERFHGWGWEDVELGFRFAERGRILHVQNPVVHHGYQSSRSLVERWERSIDNFRLLCAVHPQQTAELPIYRASTVLAKLPGLAAARAMLRFVVLSEARPVPLVIRYWSWKLLRAAIYVDALPERRKVDTYVLPTPG